MDGVQCEALIFIPLRILFQLFYIPEWDDWAYFFFAFGALLITYVQLKTLASTNAAKRFVLIVQILLLIMSGLGINYEIQTELAIKETYAEFCRATKNGDYQLAYSYFSPQYHRETGVETFKEQILDIASFSYTEACHDRYYGTMWHRWNGARLYPFAWSKRACYLFLGGAELILVRIDGKWYFTGEHLWYVD